MFQDVPFSAASFHTRTGQSWDVAESNVQYNRIQTSDGIATVQIYIEQGNVVGDDGNGLGPTHLCVNLPEGVVATGYVQQQLHYTDDSNYVAFPGDGLVRVVEGGTALEFYHLGDGSNPAGPNSGRWVPGTSVAFWATFTFPVAVAVDESDAGSGASLPPERAR